MMLPCTGGTGNPKERLLGDVSRGSRMIYQPSRTACPRLAGARENLDDTQVSGPNGLQQLLQVKGAHR